MAEILGIKVIYLPVDMGYNAFRCALGIEIYFQCNLDYYILCSSGPLATLMSALVELLWNDLTKLCIPGNSEPVS